MDQTWPFIKSIRVNKIRHLRDIVISLDETRPRHLILTGPNGSGKTSVLRALKDHLQGIPTRQLMQVETWKSTIQHAEAIIARSTSHLTAPLDEDRKAIIHSEILNNTQLATQLREQIETFNSVKPAISELVKLVELYHKGEFLISFFEAKRLAAIQTVNGAQKLDLPKVNPIEVNAQSVGSRFLQFLVNQENRAALLLRKGDTAGVAQVQAWMDNITERFRQLFDSPHLALDYDIDNFDFAIMIPGREPFRLAGNEMSDGFSSVLSIVAELLLRMEAVTAGKYDTPGIVFIDEIETHLHIKLQKAILPFLTDFFPNIQFIVTTHSPFILTSLLDAVVFDLESQTRWENMSPMSASTVVEDYFDLDLYSQEIKLTVSRFKELATIIPRSEEENEEFRRINMKLSGIEFDISPELVSEYRSICAKEAAK